jgi:hypothetical protein
MSSLSNHVLVLTVSGLEKAAFIKEYVFLARSAPGSNPTATSRDTSPNFPNHFCLLEIDFITFFKSPYVLSSFAIFYKFKLLLGFLRFQSQFQFQ